MCRRRAAGRLAGDGQGGAVAVPLAIDESSVVLAGGPAAAVKVPADSAAVLFAILDAANISARESEER